jgi:hypothetical protein
VPAQGHAHRHQKAPKVDQRKGRSRVQRIAATGRSPNLWCTDHCRHRRVGRANMNCRNGAGHQT